MEVFYLITTTRDELIELVNEKLKEGWELQGGLALAVDSCPDNPDEACYLYGQALIRKKVK